jgi:hypothetical protein
MGSREVMGMTGAQDAVVKDEQRRAHQTIAESLFLWRWVRERFSVSEPWRKRYIVNLFRVFMQAPFSKWFFRLFK